MMEQSEAMPALAGSERNAAALSPMSRRKFRPTVLHVTADYPDLNKPINTLAVKNFIDANDEVLHRIISLNRTATPWRFRVTDGGGHADPRMVSVRYAGLPLGVQLATSMYVVARLSHAIIKRQGWQFDVIHAHKFTYDGLAAYWLSLWTGKPLICSVRGEVEDKVFRFKPHYAPLYRRVAEHCRRLYYVSAWFRPEMQRRFGIGPEKERLLPNFVHIPQIVPRAEFRHNAFVSVMSFDDKRKGLDMLLPAFKQVVARVPDATLDLIGRGAPERLREIQNLINRDGLAQNVRLIGPVEHNELLHRLGSYAGLLLPSRHETFGMSYIEALLSGVAILYSNGTGVDGYLDGIQGAFGADPYSPDSIRNAILALITQQQSAREWLLKNRREVLARFDSPRHIAAYNSDLCELIKNSSI
jgi:glycosyltransferase involved in cell wall biosynthesis